MGIEQLLFSIPAVLFAISVHEFAHGMVAYRLGDPTAKYQGRLTLNPLAHMDPIGALMLLIFRFGWAKPVMVNPRYFADPRKGMIFVAIAGPLSNITLAWIFYLLFQFLPSLMPSFAVANTLAMFLVINLQLNLGLAAFNLLPLPPLDGSKVLAGMLPGRLSYQYEQLAQFGPILLILLLMTGSIQIILGPIRDFLFFVITGFGL